MVKNKFTDWRINFALTGCFLLYAVIIGKLYYLQIAKGEHYLAWVQGAQTFASKTDLRDRGEIFFANGEPLAINKDFPMAYASPVSIKDKENAASQVAQVLSLDERSLLDKFSAESMYVSLKERISEEEFAALNKAKIEGIYISQKKKRYYPQKDIAAQLVGFVDEDGNGRYGLEEYYNEELSKGQNLILNIDYNIQYQAQQMIDKAMKDLKAEQVEAIVADPKTGAILAMAKVPNFDPNDYREYAKNNIDIFKNDSCQTLFEPGSVFKAITMASALNEHKVTPETSYTDTGIVKIGRSTIYNFGKMSYGRQTMTNVLEHSVNTGVVFAEGRLGHSQFTKYIEKFGIFEPTGIDLPETFSKNSEFKKGYAVNYATASFGQGIWMTSTQLIRAYSALANGGTLVQPTIVKNDRKNIDNNKKTQIITKETSDTIAKMLASVVDNGFGKKAKVPGYTISGKTGTAQMSWAVEGINKVGYSEKTTQSFIGWFPSYDSRFLVMVKMKAPQASTAEYSAIPVFNELAKYVIYVSQLPPTEEIKKTDIPMAVPTPGNVSPTQSTPIVPKVIEGRNG